MQHTNSGIRSVRGYSEQHPPITGHHPSALQIPQVAPDIHGLMQNADHKDGVLIDFVECQMSAGDQPPGSLQEIRTIGPHHGVLDETSQGAVDVIEISVRLVGTPSTVSLHPDVDEVGSGGFAQPDITRHLRQIRHVPHV